MDKTYAPKAIESEIYALWEEKHYFQPTGYGKPYAMMLPPPNVTGSLHMGHGFQHTLMDVLIRYHRMLGDKTLWQPGTDHAGISTQLVVERQLEAQGIAKKNLSREDFLRHVFEWKESSGKTITQQMRRLGVSPDWARERFTMDDGLSEVVKKVFIQLYEEGLIYRGKRLVNWDPKLKTAVSDLEVITTEEAGFLWHIHYPIVGSEARLTIATTRPETLLGDVAVAVHPEDPRYQALIGEFVHLPLCDRTIPIIADDSVDRSFGTGCVKITPAHDFNDYALGKRHQLPLIQILTKRAHLNKNVPEPYQGMDRLIARERILSDLDHLGLLAKTEPHRLNIPRGEKSQAIIEPLLTDQWYVNIKPLAKPAIDAVERGEIQFIPSHWTKTYYQWMETIEDWCISRQLWWGHRIPAWYDSQGHIYVGHSEEDVRFKYQLPKDYLLKQDEDVLDTWFSSALWPFSTLGWPEQTAQFQQFYPTSLLVTGFDIIFFWVARMVMMGLKFTHKVPFKEVLITGLIRDSEGQKMSKSKGNVLDPLDLIDGISLADLIEKRTKGLLLTSQKEAIIQATQKEYPNGIPAFGTDALRFMFCALASFNRTIRFDFNRLEGYRHFCNKLWNASRFVLLHTEEDSLDFDDGAFEYSLSDQWILSRLQKTIAQSHQHLKTYRFDLLAQTLYDFVWHEYCDWYLELSKLILINPHSRPATQRAARHTLIHVLDHSLRLLHPIIPFITEAVWQQLHELTHLQKESIMISRYPTSEPHFINEELEQEMLWLQGIIQGIRLLRSNLQLKPSQTIAWHYKDPTGRRGTSFKHYRSLLMAMTKATDLSPMPETLDPAGCVSQVVVDLELFIPIAGLIDTQVELARLDKELAERAIDIARSEAKLQSKDFIERAPHAVVEKEQARLAQAQQSHAKSLKQRTLLANTL